MSVITELSETETGFKKSYIQKGFAQVCRDNYSPVVSFCLWVLCELLLLHVTLLK